MASSFNKRTTLLYFWDGWRNLGAVWNRYNQSKSKRSWRHRILLPPINLCWKRLITSEIAWSRLGWSSTGWSGPQCCSRQGDHACHRLEELSLFWIKVRVQYSQTEDSVTVLGVSKHSKDAAEGVNAIVGLWKAIPHPTPSSFCSYRSMRWWGCNWWGSISGPISDEPSGDLSFNLATLEWSRTIGNRLISWIPVLADMMPLVARLQEIAASYQLEYEEFDYLPPLYVPLIVL